MSRLSVNDLSLTLQGKRILNSVTMPEVSGGEIIAVIGPNGAGKSSFVKCLCNLYKHTGKICVDRTPITAASKKSFAKNIGYVPQTIGAGSHLQVSEMLVLALKADSLAWGVKQSDLLKMAEMLDRLHISHLQNKYCSELSGGQLQMVSLAQALITNPSLLILDEPTSALDLSNQLQTLALVRDYVDTPLPLPESHTPKKPIALVVVHDLNLALRFADKVMLLSDGELASFGALPDTLTPALIQAHFNVETELLYGSDNRPSLAVLRAI